MSWQDVIVLTIVAAAGVFVGRYLWRTFSGKGGCQCEGNTGACGARRQEDAMGLKRTRLVTLDPNKSPAEPAD